MEKFGLIYLDYVKNEKVRVGRAQILGGFGVKERGCVNLCLDFVKVRMRKIYGCGKSEGKLEK